MAVFNNILAGAAGQGGAAADAGYVIPKSLRFNPGDSSHLSRTPSSSGNRRTFTYSCWFKRANTGSNPTLYQHLFDANDGSSNFFDVQINPSGNILLYHTQTSQQYITTEATFNDYAAWYHFVLAVDTTQSTDSNRVKFYINGVQLTDLTLTNGGWPNQNVEFIANSAVEHEIGGRNNASGDFFGGCLADIQFVDGQQLAATDFGQLDDNNVWQAKEYTTTFQLASGTPTTANGGIVIKADDSSINGTFVVNGGVKTWTSPDGQTWTRNGEGRSTAAAKYLAVGGAGTATKSFYPDAGSGNYTYFVYNGNEFDGSGSPFTLDLTSQTYIAPSDSSYGLTGFHLDFSDNSSNAALGYDQKETVTLNPAGGMDVVTYTGNGGTQNIGGLNFEPGLIWLKSRSESARSHSLYDNVRGASKVLKPDNTDSEVTMTGVTSFNPDGFTLGSHVNSNNNNVTYVAWTWQAGGPAVANTDGTITSQVSANTDYGFSVVTYTGTGSAGATVGHGLGSVIKFMLVKNRSDADIMVAYHSSVGNTGALRLTTAATDTGYNWWNSTTPSSSLFTIGNTGATNNSSDNYVAYCWSEVSGYSKFGSWTGTGSAGLKVTTGFKPRWILIKKSNGSADWLILDTERGTDLGAGLYPNASYAEASYDYANLLDDGFTLNTGDLVNASGDTYIYAAFADRPGNNWDVNNIVTNEGLTTSKTQFDMVTYTGNSGTQSIDSLGFQPDFVWIKNRNGAHNHMLFDAVRGAGADLMSNATSAENSGGSNDLTSFDSNGFSLGSNNAVNQSSRTFVAWCWKAGGTAVSNTDGTITSSVSANAAYGFSIVSYSGTGSGTQSVGHGLSSVPALVITKSRGATGSWRVFTDIGGTYKIGNLNNTDAFVNASVSSPTSSVFNVDGNSNASTTHVAYCFANVPGYQRIGTFVGGGNTDTTVVTGFKPRFLLAKNITAHYWWMVDSERATGNPFSEILHPNVSDAEVDRGANENIRFNSDGFTIEGNVNTLNQSGATFIYLAIGDDEIGSDEDCLVDVPNAVTADADATDTTGGYQRGNYATLNPLYNTSSGATLSDGNLKFVTAGSNGNSAMSATIAVSSGKWFWEITPTSIGSGVSIGIAYASEQTTDYPGYPATSWSYRSNGTKMNNASSSSYGVSYTTDDVIGVALDLDAGTLEFYKNGVAQGTAFTSLSGEFVPKIGDLGSASTMVANFGASRFKYPIPSGYATLNTTALPAATIADGSTAFDTKLWTGNGSSGRSITGYEFSPDLAWIKNRSNTGGYNHILVDSVRGAGKYLTSNANSAESTFGYISALNSDGFTISNHTEVNGSSNTYVGWAWDAGSSTVSNTDGSITSSVRANPTAGFSICKITTPSSDGAYTFGHGLNAVPKLVIYRIYDQSMSWYVHHGSLNANEYLLLNSTNAKSSGGSVVFNNTYPTSSVVSDYAGNSSHHNEGRNMIYYCFAPVEGYSAFGTYLGNLNANGSFAFCGFAPALVVVKAASSTGNWYAYDRARGPINPNDNEIYWNLTAQEYTINRDIDFLSNGFKIRTNDNGFNASGVTYIWMAWAENPFQANGGIAR